MSILKDLKKNEVKKMGYIENKREFKQTLNELLETKKGETISILSLEYQAGLKYGFGALAIKRELSTLAELGLIKINDTDKTFTILG